MRSAFRSQLAPQRCCGQRGRRRLTCSSYSGSTNPVCFSACLPCTQRCLTTPRVTRNNHRANCACVYRQVRLYPKMSVSAGEKCSTSTSSTVWVPQKCCTSICRIRPTTWSMAPAASRYQAMIFVCSMKVASRWAPTKSVNYWCAAARQRLAIGTSSARVGKPLPDNGPVVAISTHATRKGDMCIAGAPMTCSKSVASGSRRSRWNRH